MTSKKSRSKSLLPDVDLERKGGELVGTVLNDFDSNHRLITSQVHLHLTVFAFVVVRTLTNEAVLDLRVLQAGAVVQAQVRLAAGEHVLALLAARVLRADALEVVDQILADARVEARMALALVELQLTVVALEARVAEAAVVVNAVLARTVMTVHVLTCEQQIRTER